MEKFKFWCQRVLPLVYNDSLSYYEVLCKIVDYINALINQDVEFSDKIEQMMKIVNEFDETTATGIRADIDALEKRMDNNSAELDELHNELRVVQTWIENYDTSFIKSVVDGYIATMIFLELTDTGYIVIYVPETWDDVKFNTTGFDIEIEGQEYGKLVLSY